MFKNKGLLLLMLVLSAYAPVLDSRMPGAAARTAETNRVSDTASLDQVLDVLRDGGYVYHNVLSSALRSEMRNLSAEQYNPSVLVSIVHNILQSANADVYAKGIKGAAISILRLEDRHIFMTSLEKAQAQDALARNTTKFNEIKDVEDLLTQAHANKANLTSSLTAWKNVKLVLDSIRANNDATKIDFPAVVGVNNEVYQSITADINALYAKSAEMATSHAAYDQLNAKLDHTTKTIEDVTQARNAKQDDLDQVRGANPDLDAALERAKQEHEQALADANTDLAAAKQALVDLQEPLAQAKQALEARKSEKIPLNQAESAALLERNQARGHEADALKTVNDAKGALPINMQGLTAQDALDWAVVDKNGAQDVFDNLPANPDEQEKQNATDALKNANALLAKAQSAFDAAAALALAQEDLAAKQRVLDNAQDAVEAKNIEITAAEQDVKIEREIADAENHVKAIERDIKTLTPGAVQEEVQYVPAVEEEEVVQAGAAPQEPQPEPRALALPPRAMNALDRLIAAKEAAKVITDAEAAIVALNAELALLNGKHDALDAKIGELAVNTDSLSREITRIKNRLADNQVENVVRELEGALAQVDAELGETQGLIAEMIQSIPGAKSLEDAIAQKASELQKSQALIEMLNKRLVEEYKEQGKTYDGAL